MPAGRVPAPASQFLRDEKHEHTTQSQAAGRIARAAAEAISAAAPAAFGIVIRPPLDGGAAEPSFAAPHAPGFLARHFAARG
ncbi:MAG TPA: hypothetical protein VFE05_17805 [Longimicrobiaceae bacterium]|jgi:hypothetical protein|nr:hypothetical protein [Longimicrobiaceae bacterium]